MSGAPGSSRPGYRPGASSGNDPGVPEAIPRVVRLVGRRLGPAAIDRIWIFPPLRQGRKESGLVAVSCFEPQEDQRRLVTASYVAERTGRGLTLEPSLLEEGAAPPDTLPHPPVLGSLLSSPPDNLGKLELSTRGVMFADISVW